MAGQSKFRYSNSAFTEEHETFIILKYGEVGCISKVKRSFETRFFPKNPRKVPHQKQFQRLVDRFLKTGSVNQQPPPGPKLITADINRVKDYFNMNPRTHLRVAMIDLYMSIGKIWKILRKDLNFKPNRPHTAQILSCL